MYYSLLLNTIVHTEFLYIINRNANIKSQYKIKTVLHSHEIEIIKLKIYAINYNIQPNRFCNITFNIIHLYTHI